MPIYNKLVRDRIPDIIREDGRTCKTRILAPDDFVRSLKEKLTEEVEEFLQNPSVEELADIVEVVDALSKALDSSFSHVLETKEAKRTKRGGFEERILLECAED